MYIFPMKVFLLLYSIRFKALWKKNSMKYLRSTLHLSTLRNIEVDMPRSRRTEVTEHWYFKYQPFTLEDREPERLKSIVRKESIIHMYSTLFPPETIASHKAGLPLGPTLTYWQTKQSRYLDKSTGHVNKHVRQCLTKNQP